MLNIGILLLLLNVVLLLYCRRASSGAEAEPRTYWPSFHEVSQAAEILCAKRVQREGTSDEKGKLKKDAPTASSGMISLGLNRCVKRATDGVSRSVDKLCVEGYWCGKATPTVANVSDRARYY